MVAEAKPVASAAARSENDSVFMTVFGLIGNRGFGLGSGLFWILRSGIWSVSCGLAVVSDAYLQSSFACFATGFVDRKHAQRGSGKIFFREKEGFFRRRGPEGGGQRPEGGGQKSENGDRRAGSEGAWFLKMRELGDVEVDLRLRIADFGFWIGRSGGAENVAELLRGDGLGRLRKCAE